jgi:DNA-binding IclR family transcriptional regulator
MSVSRARPCGKNRPGTLTKLKEVLKPEIDLLTRLRGGCIIIQNAVPLFGTTIHASPFPTPHETRQSRMDDRASVRTIDRMVEVLNCFTVDRPAWSLAELSARLELPKSTLHRFLVGLERNGLTQRGDEDGKWRMGHRLVIWGSRAAETTGIQRIAAPVMRELAETSRETILLTEYHDGEVVCMDKIDTSHSVRIALEVGDRRAPHAGASSKVLMAYLSESEIAQIIAAKGLPRYCERTITEPDELRRELARIRQNGYALSYEETDCGAWGIATPVRDWRGRVIAGLGIAGPTVRYSEEAAQRYVTLCCAAAARISELLGAS